MGCQYVQTRDQGWTNEVWCGCVCVSGVCMCVSEAGGSVHR